MTSNHDSGLTSGRRGLFRHGGALALGLAATATMTGQAQAQTQGQAAAPPAGSTEAMRRPLPAQAAAKMDMAQAPGAKLAYWDTGGTGPAVVLLHPGTGSHAIWGYQQPVLAAAGFRVIAYSRRGYMGSESGPEDDTGSGAGDLLALLDHLKIDRCHLVGSAAGAIVAMDFAAAHPGRLLSQTLACTIMGINDPGYSALSASLRPRGFNEMPAEFREVGPSYRAANPEGVKAWVELEHQALVGKRINQRPLNKVTWESLRALTVPTLLIGGDADLWSPPSVIRMFAEAIPKSEIVIIPEAGHSAYWEQPEAFNAAILGFMKRRG